MRRHIPKLSPIGRRFPAKPASKKRPLGCETLERRVLLAADLSVSAAEPFAGEEVAVDATAHPAAGSASTDGPQMALGISDGDLTGDGRVNAEDIDMLCSAWQDGGDSAFDLTGDAIVDKSDMDYLVEGILDTNYGDANLDSQVNLIDFETWNLYRFQPDKGWAGADFSCDGVTDVRDFNLWNQHKNLAPINSLSVTNPAPADELATQEQASLDAATTARNSLGSTGTPQTSDKPGDFNDDDVVDATDIDILAEGLRTGIVVADYDLDGNGAVNHDDMDELIWGVIGTQYGDANLDGDVNIGDFAVWQAYRFTSDGGWSSGDFNGDGVNDVSDYNIWNSNRSVSAVAFVASGKANPVTSEPAVDESANTGFTDVPQTVVEAEMPPTRAQPVAREVTRSRVVAQAAKITPRPSAEAQVQFFARLRRMSLRF